MRKKNSLFSKFYIAICFAFFYLPILVTMIFSFNSSKSLSKFTGFSLRWYKALLENSEIMSAVYVSVTIAILATIASTVLGTMTAIGLSKSRKIIKDMVLGMNDIPILNPDIVTAIGWMLLFSSLGFQKGYITMLLAHIAFCTPYVITSVYPKVRSLDPNLANAAMDLGATPYQALTKIIIPMIRPGIFAGALLAFTMSFDDFVISYFVSGNGVKNISIVVYNMTKRINPTINALSTIVIVVIVVILLLANLLPRLGGGDNKNNNQNMKKLVAGVAVFALVLSLVTCVANKSNNKEARVLKVYNAGEYIDPDLLTEFQDEYNCTVIYETFESNEMMYTKLQAGDAYDILIPSDYMIERLIKEEYLQPIDWDCLTNAEGLNPDVMNKEYDPGNVYSVPYFWGNVGILYDKTVVDPADLSEGWNLLMDTKYAGNLYMYDSERDSFMMALKALGYSMNTENPDEIQAAYEWLLDMNNTMNPTYVTDEVIDGMMNSNKDIAVVYSGDATYVQSENEDMSYWMPKEGTNLWYDAMVMTKDCENTELAYEFMDFMLRDDVAYRNTQYVGYSSPVVAAYEQAQEEDYEGIEAYVPRVGYEKDEIFRYQDTDIKKLFAELWTKVKAQ